MISVISPARASAGATTIRSRGVITVSTGVRPNSNTPAMISRSAGSTIPTRSLSRRSVSRLRRVNARPRSRRMPSRASRARLVASAAAVNGRKIHPHASRISETAWNRRAPRVRAIDRGRISPIRYSGGNATRQTQPASRKGSPPPAPLRDRPSAISAAATITAIEWPTRMGLKSRYG